MKMCEVGLSRKGREGIQILAEALSELFEKDHKREWFEEKGINYDTHQKSQITFPWWQQTQVSYYFMELIGDSEIKAFNGRYIANPTYKVMEYKRGHTKSLLVEGYSSVKYDEKTFVLALDNNGRVYWITVYHNREDQEIAKKLLDELQRKIELMEFLRGEKLLVKADNEIDFFKFKKTTKENLILSGSLWKSLEKNLFFFLDNKDDLLKNNIEWRRGLLLWGLPGTGKTLFGRYLCTTLKKITVLWITPKCVSDSGDVEKLFEIARILSPTIVFIEDLDFLAANREQYGFSPILGELLTQLDGISPNDGVFIVATTNDQHALDRAIASRPSRFDVRLEFKLPEKEEREKLFRLFLNNATDVDYSKLVASGEKLSCAHLKEACVRGKVLKMSGVGDLTEFVLKSIHEVRREEIERKLPEGLIS